MNTMNQLLLGAVVLSASLSAQATLFDRGNGMIYDSDQDITWLQDANYAATQYAATNGVEGDQDGFMNWNAANLWADSLTVGGYTDWRLATINPDDTDGCQHSINGTDCGFNVDTSTSELAYLYYDILGNKGYYDTLGSSQTGYGILNTAADGVDFLNVQSEIYWSGTEYAPNTGNAWYFFTNIGKQRYGNKGVEFYSWAVRSGDVASQAVPEPSIIALLGLGLFGIAVSRRKVKK